MLKYPSDAGRQKSCSAVYVSHIVLNVSDTVSVAMRRLRPVVIQAAALPLAHHARRTNSLQPACYALTGSHRRSREDGEHLGRSGDLVAVHGGVEGVAELNLVAVAEVRVGGWCCVSHVLDVCQVDSALRMHMAVVLAAQRLKPSSLASPPHRYFTLIAVVTAVTINQA
jgi:hypothetical protein